MSKKYKMYRKPDEYRGDLSCVGFCFPVRLEHISQPYYIPEWCREHRAKVFDKKSGKLIGILQSWYGNFGQGRLAAEAFEAAEGVEIEWVE